MRVFHIPGIYYNCGCDMKIFSADGEYRKLRLMMQEAPEITAAVRNRQLHVYRNGKKIIILTGKAGIKVLKEECLLNDKNC